MHYRRDFVRHALAAFVTGVPMLAAWAQTAANMDGRLDMLFGAHAPYRVFLERLQAAVAADDRAGVAALAAYPLNAHLGSKKVTVRDAKRFIADYDRLLSPRVKAAIARQTYANLFANAQGVSVGDGELWFSGVGRDAIVRIIAING
ncbi:MAG TPA: hypothetical protein VGC24_07490 [Burkholderiaceae bacterium]